jgi:plastocyanin
MGKRLLTVFMVLLSAGLIGLAAGCGDDDDDEGGDAAATTTEETTAADTGGGGAQSVSMVDYGFEPADATAASGDTIELTNDGEVPHNYTIVEGDPTGGGAEVAASDDIDSGGSGSLTVDAEPGDYGVLCTIPGHADQGMVGSIKVE